MLKFKNKKSLYVLLIVCVLGIVGATIAFYSSTDTFNNIFGTKIYKMEVVETFESPDDWTPGTETPKTIVATNKGDVDAAVRVSYVEEWKDASDNTLPLVDTNSNRAAIINFADDYENKWIKSTENSKDYYYYKVKLSKNESTTSLLKSVTFNPNVTINTANDCTTDTNTNTRTCTTQTSGYAGGTYTLTVTIETIQFDQYKNGWNTDVNIAESLIAYEIVSGDLDTIGSVVKIGDEEFYVIGQEDTNHVKLFAKYNLKVGNNFDLNVDWNTPASVYDSSVPGYGLQSPEAVGYIDAENKTFGTVGLRPCINEHDEYYWVDWEAWDNNIDKPLPQYGDEYPAYIYTTEKENGEYILTIAQYIVDYTDYLKSLGANVTGRLISLQDLFDVVNNGIVPTDYDYSLKGKPGYNGREWIAGTSYWVGNANLLDLYFVNIDGTMGGDDSTCRNDMAGVRPVIILEK